MKQVRLYGHQLGYSSFSQVTRGFAKALDAHGLFGGFVPIDFYDTEVDYPGSTCPISVNTGMPGAVAHSKLLGTHAERLLMLAPNSDLIPPAMREWIPKILTGLLGPSKWGCQVLRRMCPTVPVHYVPHGVHEEYAPMPEVRAEMLQVHRAGAFRTLHMTSTNSERKATKEILHAWQGLGPEHVLTVVCRFEGFEELEQLVHASGLWGRVQLLASDGAEYAEVSRLYANHHVVLQPSRAEGFGLIPLEARACGVPAVLTNCTGHTEHARVGASVIVETGPDAPLDDLEGATAPSVSPDAIRAAVESARRNYEQLSDLALKTAPDIRKEFSWAEKTGRPMKEIASQ